MEDLFGFDSAAQIGLELRFGLMEGTQVGIHRTNDRTIQFLGQRELIRQGPGMPVTIDALVTVEGLNNFREQYSTGVGAVVSRRIARRLAVYVEPIWVANTNPLPGEETDDNHTFQIGLASRLRVGARVYLLGEFIPRTAGLSPGKQPRVPRGRNALRRSPVSAERLERTRDDDGSAGARWTRPQRLVHWVQLEPQVLLAERRAAIACPVDLQRPPPGEVGVRRGDRQHELQCDGIKRHHSSTCRVEPCKVLAKLREGRRLEHHEVQLTCAAAGTAPA